MNVFALCCNKTAGPALGKRLLSTGPSVALSTGCLIGNQAYLPQINAAELSAHTEEQLYDVIAGLGLPHGSIVSVHAPCPKRPFAPNLSATGKALMDALSSIRDSAKVAEVVGAPYVILHAFYCGSDSLPQDDRARAQVMRISDHIGPQTLAQYLSSSDYLGARSRALANLKCLLPSFKREFPRQMLLLENLNPKIGYGGIRLQDVLWIVEQLDGDVGICLDIGHLHLTASVIEDDWAAAITSCYPHIHSCHVHQNFGGKYYIDRNWSDLAPIPGMQELDTHSPLTGTYRLLGAYGDDLASENTPFASLISDVVQFSIDGVAPVIGTVPVRQWLSLVPDSALRILELDSRYAPLSFILAEFAAAANGQLERELGY